MIRTIILYVIIVFSSSFVYGQVEVSNLLCENRINPLGVDNENPRFSWQLNSVTRNVIQMAYEIRVSENESFEEIIWNSGKVESDQSVYVKYNGSSLKSGQKYYWQVKVWDNKGNNSSWSNTAFWQMGLLKKSDWKAEWIQTVSEENITKSSPVFRKEFSLDKQIISATAFVTAYGMYEAEINGERVGDSYLTPGWTTYKTRLQYQTYDVTELAKSGKNAVGITLGNGWYRENLGNIPYDPSRNLSLLFQLEILYSDGNSELILSDGSWKSSTGPIISNQIYHGETIDARLIKEGWSSEGYDDSTWGSVKVVDLGYANLITTLNEPVRKHETLKPVEMIITPKGETVLDFGQNMVGWVQVKVRGKEGEKISIQHAEILDKEGNFYVENLRSAKAEANYILRGKGEETFEPHFTFYGFRYIKIDGYPGEINLDNFKAIALYSDMKPAGEFNCSDNLINQLQHNIQWGQKGNFIDVPTDCPQRDERLGWTGDAQVFARTAAFNMNIHNFFKKWLSDLKAEQDENGAIPMIVPNAYNVVMPVSGWSDAGTIIPWEIYLAYGDKQILADQYESMKAWVNFMQSNSKGNLFTLDFQFGDWLFYSPSPDDYGRAAVTDKDLISQCFYAYSTKLLINAANVLDKDTDVANYSELLKKIKETFVDEFITPSGRLVSNTQTAYVLALNFDMLPEQMRTGAAERLADNVNDYQNHLTTGFLGTPYLTHVLSRFGYTDVAYKLLLQKTYPSWLYPVTMGATTIWERWDGIKPDSTLQTPEMNSFNHYAYGAIGDWLYRVVLGIDTYKEFPGYKKIKIKPHTSDSLTFAHADLRTYYGIVSSYWNLENGNFTLDVEIPVNTTATVYVPARENSTILESEQNVAEFKEISALGNKDGYSIFEIGSGKYKFTVID